MGSSVTRQSPGNVLDKIQAELAETKRREEELRRARREMFRSQPDLSKETSNALSRANPILPSKFFPVLYSLSHLRHIAGRPDSKE